MSAYLSAFGAKRTCRERSVRVDRALLTHSGHKQFVVAAMHSLDLLYSP